MNRKRRFQERRTLGTTAGGSTYIITLPKAWVEDLELKKGEELALVRIDPGIYLAPTDERKAHQGKPSSRTQLAVSGGLTGEALARSIISRYIAGYDVIEITGRIQIDEREIVRQTAQRLIGAEILQETSDFFLIHTLRDPQVLSVPQLLDYIHENTEAMLADAPNALLDGDVEKARGVMQRDERVDRFFLLLSRQLYATLRDPLAEVDRQISRVEFFNTHTVARQLERIADHAVKIASSAQAIVKEGRTVPRELAHDLRSVNGAVQQLVTQVMRAFLDLNGPEAQRALIALPRIEQNIQEMDRMLLDLDDSHLAFHLSIVVDSIGRVKDYASNIAELSLNAEALRG